MNRNRVSRELLSRLSRCCCSVLRLPLRTGFGAGFSNSGIIRPRALKKRPKARPPSQWPILRTISWVKVLPRRFSPPMRRSDAYVVCADERSPFAIWKSRIPAAQAGALWRKHMLPRAAPRLRVRWFAAEDRARCRTPLGKSQPGSSSLSNARSPFRSRNNPRRYPRPAKARAGS
jgi:hypothetical protein